ncbi:MAG: hypothetical protein ACE5HD_05610 [Acidobacteriota bacterium]
MQITRGYIVPAVLAMVFAGVVFVPAKGGLPADFPHPADSPPPGDGIGGTVHLLQVLRRNAPSAIPAFLLARPLVPHEQVASSEDGHFLVHFSRPTPRLSPDAGGDAVLRTVRRVTEALATARSVLIRQDGWREAGGDLPVDVYLLGAQEAGSSRAVPLSDPALSPEEGSGAFMVVTGEPDSWPSQAVHQYLHVLQLGYSTHEAIWFYEATAALLEMRLAGKDGLPADLVARRLARPDRSLMAENPDLLGGGAVFLAFLAQMYDEGIPRMAWELSASGYGRNTLAALDSALRLSRSATLVEAWRAYTTWNGYRGATARPGQAQAGWLASLPPAATAREVTRLPAGAGPGEALHLEPLSAAYVGIHHLGDIGGMQVEVDAGAADPISADLLVSWRHVPDGWLAIPLSFHEGRARLGVPLEPESEVILVIRNDGTLPEASSNVTFDLSAAPGFPFELSFLAAEASPGQIDLSWGSASEHRIYGWRVYRAVDSQGPFLPLNRFPVPSMGDSDSPLAYHFTDTRVAPGRVYYYLVEGITVDGLARRSAMVARRSMPEAAGP